MGREQLWVLFAFLTVHVLHHQTFLSRSSQRVWITRSSATVHRFTDVMIFISFSSSVPRFRSAFSSTILCSAFFSFTYSRSSSSNWFFLFDSRVQTRSSIVSSLVSCLPLITRALAVILRFTSWFWHVLIRISRIFFIMILRLLRRWFQAVAPASPFFLKLAHNTYLRPLPSWCPFRVIVRLLVQVLCLQALLVEEGGDMSSRFTCVNDGLGCCGVSTTSRSLSSDHRLLTGSSHAPCGHDSVISSDKVLVVALF